MTSHLRLGGAALLCALLALAPVSHSVAVADEAPDPRPAPAAEKPKPAENAGSGTVLLKIDEKATATKILISRKALAQLQGLEVPPAKKDTGFINSPERTIGAGLAMTLALVLGGLYLARRNRHSALRPAVLLAAVALVGVAGASTLVLADRAPAPKPEESHADVTFSRINLKDATVRASDGDAIELSLGRGTMILFSHKFKKPNP